ncbi:hypothetical protein GCM10012275_11420 [Longimycelium tulufanense]|uniref:Uncharacterized protein n=1 Tax=Longimycelium tulufanense TaxID=907463 RepID=A0A8J3C6N1_9PSEU|nr:hypothetical protein [Longimycelium tulufanense]GGM42152.1 hypothetical protein GCM10012275_11420 [Longimycelium tulufanense]
MLSLQHAAFALGWRGVVIADVAVLGSRVSAVVRVHRDVHRWRVRNGWPPETDPSWFRSWFEPELHDRLPVSAVELVGVLVEEATLHNALRACGTLMTLAPCAVVLSTPQHDPWPLIELDYYGIGVVTTLADGSSEVSIPPEDRSGEFGPSLFGRWLLEVLYDRVLKAEVARARARR